MSGMGFLALENRYIVEGTLAAEAALHVGGGVSEKTEAACFRDAAGLVIPGSSLRGVMRSTLERILQALPGKKGCVLFE
ncbi:MAG: hypothetical protein FJW34_25345, partial [Acidobacteria bacterium]|nr:hypothetical protein [Acidobacteriota bacterium]